MYPWKDSGVYSPPRRAVSEHVRTAALLCLLLTGCAARFDVVQKDVSISFGDYEQRTITTKINAKAVNTSAQTLTNLKVSQTDKTQSTGLGALSQQGATNGIEYLRILLRIAETLRPPM